MTREFGTKCGTCNETLSDYENRFTGRVTYYDFQERRETEYVRTPGVWHHGAEPWFVKDHAAVPVPMSREDAESRHTCCDVDCFGEPTRHCCDEACEFFLLLYSRRPDFVYRGGQWLPKAPEPHDPRWPIRNGRRFSVQE